MQDLRELARQKDGNDPLRKFRPQFYFPKHQGKDAIYFCGNSLGLQPRSVEAAIMQELKDWQDLAVGGYMHAKTPWLTYLQNFREPLAKVVGCLPAEVTAMNTLTINLHLLLSTFYQPLPSRYKIIMEAGAFPSDQYAVETQVRFHGFAPDDAIVEIHPRQGEKTLREEDIIATIDRHKDSLALVLLGGINYYTGQYFDIPAITAAAHQAGALAGFDLAHTAGNIPLRLHDWDVDFAVWCSYKYLNGGPGAVGGAYLHERFARDRAVNRLADWWGNEEATGAAQVFNMVALKASLELFEAAGMDAIRTKSTEMTSWLSQLLQQLTNLKFEIITPVEPERRGAQLSLFFSEKGREIHQRMMEAGIIVDYREPGVICVAPAPLYNSYEDIYRFYHILKTFD